MNKTFEQEWNLYKAGGKRPSFAGEAPRGDAEFDSPVKVGEIRIFADMARPFVALVASSRRIAELPGSSSFPFLRSQFPRRHANFWKVSASISFGMPAPQRGVLSSAAGSSIRLMAKSWRHW